MVQPTAAEHALLTCFLVHDPAVEQMHGAPRVTDESVKRVVVLFHEFAFIDVISASFGTEDQETIESRPVIHFPRVTAGRVANLGRTRNRLRLRRDASVEELCV